MNASAITLRALWIAMAATIAALVAIGGLVAAAGVADAEVPTLALQVLLLDVFLAFVLGAVVLWAYSPQRVVPPRRETAGIRQPLAEVPFEPYDRTEDLGPTTPARGALPSPLLAAVDLPRAVATPRASVAVAASSIVGTYEERRWSEDKVTPAPPFSDDPEVMRASLSFSPGLHPELRADRFRSSAPAPPPTFPLTPGIPSAAPRPGLSLSRSGARATSGVASGVGRVPAPPTSAAGTPVVGRRMCVSCGTSLTGATTDPLCVGCGRPLCTSCYWRAPTGGTEHRCPSCLTSAALSPAASRSGGIAATSPSGPSVGRGA